MTMIDNASRVRNTHGTKSIRVLLSRTLSYAVKTSLFSEVLAQTIRIEAMHHSPAETARWILAMFNARHIASQATAVPQDLEELAQRIQSAALSAGASRKDLSRAVRDVIQSVYGQQMRVTGWLPGFRVMESQELLELTGEACPACTVNPAVRDRGREVSCLNSEECGWVKK